MKGKWPKIALAVVVVAVLITVLVMVLGRSAPAETLTIFHAGSLAVPFADLAAEFEGSHTDVDVDVDRQSGGSATVISNAIVQEDAGESPPDIIASADYKLIPDRMYGGGYADWYIAFARNTMVICYRDNAPGSAEIVIGNRTWFDVLRNDPVSYGHSDPDQDPCGYRTLLVVQLAQAYYYDDATSFDVTPGADADGLYDTLIPKSEHERGRTGGTNSTARPGGSEEVVSAKSVDLITALEAGDLDYAFEYRSVAVQNELNYIELDDYINLSRTNAEIEGIEDFYATASIEILEDPGPPEVYEPQYGAAIVYGVTIPVHAQNGELAAEFIELLLSETGKQIIETENGQPMLDPPLCDHPENLPDLLQPLFE